MEEKSLGFCLFVCFVLEQNLFDEALIDMFIFIFFTLFKKNF